MMLQITLYAVLSFLVALLAIGKRGGFLLHFVLALLLTPITGIILVLLAADKKDDQNLSAKSGRA